MYPDNGNTLLPDHSLQTLHGCIMMLPAEYFDRQSYKLESHYFPPDFPFWLSRSKYEQARFWFVWPIDSFSITSLSLYGKCHMRAFITASCISLWCILPLDPFTRPITHVRHLSCMVKQRNNSQKYSHLYCRLHNVLRKRL